MVKLPGTVTTSKKKQKWESVATDEHLKDFAHTHYARKRTTMTTTLDYLPSTAQLLPKWRRLSGYVDWYSWARRVDSGADGERPPKPLEVHN